MPPGPTRCAYSSSCWFETIHDQPVYTAATSAKKTARTQKITALTFMFCLLHLLVSAVVHRSIRSILGRADAHRDAGLRVVEVERRGLGTDPRDRGEVVARRRARSGPLKRASIAPRVVHGHLRCLARRDVHVEQEGDHRDAEDHGTHRGQ